MMRDYQEAAVSAVLRELDRVRTTLIVMPTGTGKTVVFAELARRWLDAGGRRVLVLAHREELIQQAKDKLRAFAGLQSDIERADDRAPVGMFESPVVVATVQTLARQARLDRFGPDGFGLVIIDEAHHAPSATYRQIVDFFAGAKVLGVTATPDRSDGEAMGQVFESVAFVYEIRDAIDEKHLVPIRQKAVEVAGLDLSSVRTTAGDLNEGDLTKILMEEENLHGIAHPTRELAGDRPTVVFSPSVEHAHSLAAVLDRGKPGCARALDGTAPPDLRARTLADFRSGAFQFLVNCALFTEGFDEPSIACVAVARPTKSRALYVQMVGRGTRLCPPDKKDLLVLDFKGNAGRHKLVTALDILAGNEDPEVVERARALAAKGELALHEAIDEARARLAEERRRKILARARFEAVDVDPFQALGVAPFKKWWSDLPPTEKQIGHLAGAGVPLRSDLTRGQAAALLNEIGRRRYHKLAEYKDAIVLIKHGMDPDIPASVAGRVIDRLKRREGVSP